MPEKTTIDTRLEKILTEAIEGQMDWEAYYAASYEEPLEQIKQLFVQIIEENKVEIKNTKFTLFRCEICGVLPELSIEKKHCIDYERSGAKKQREKLLEVLK